MPPLKKRRYPKHRKKPYRHRVRSHIRAGIRVKAYWRGEGPPPKGKPSKPQTLILKPSQIAPKAPRFLRSGKTRYTVMQVDVKSLEANGVVIYVDGEGNIVAYDIKGEDGWWSWPRIATTKLRSPKIYGRKSVLHPAKMNPLWAQRMIQEYTKPGDWILDPMAGGGTTGIEASRLGRNAVIADIDPTWVREMMGNVKRLRKSGQMRGSLRVMKADATKADYGRKFDAIMFSPPYAGQTALAGCDVTWGGARGGYVGKWKAASKRDFMPEVYRNLRKFIKPGGVLVINVKDRIENGKYIDVETPTIKTVEAQGWKLIAKHNIYAPPSHVRTAAEKNNPDMPHIRHETFLVFKKVGR